MSKDNQTIHSMTCFGQAEKITPMVRIVVEIRAVNSRYLDLNFRLPKEYSSFEPDGRQLLQSSFRRGRVDVFVSREKTSQTSSPTINLQLLKEQYEATLEIVQKLGADPAKISEQLLLELLKRKDLFESNESEDMLPEERELFLECLREASSDAAEMRRKEGASLQSELLLHLDQLLQIGEELSDIASKRAQQYRQKLEGDLKQLLQKSTLDPTRFEMEVALLVEKSDVTEELARLQSHQQQFRSFLEQVGTGRKMDFLLQEFGRELNTVASKISDSSAQHLVVEGKAVVERMREQVQNVE